MSAARLRVLLAALVLRANEPVSVDALADAVWDGVPPAGAAATLRSYVMRLRRALGPAAKRIVTHDPGYLIRLDERESDVLMFETLCRATGSAIQAGSWGQASSSASQALALWRAAPLADIGSPVLRETWVPRLERLRLQTLEWRAEAELRLGRVEQLLAELRELTERHPLRERFHAQLMLALARCGQRAAALDAYQRARRFLIEELGVEPGTELRELQQRILAGDVEPAHPHDARAPRQLPAAVPHFTGRTAELATLTASLGGGAVVISAIGGTAGVGKTALALHWAHQVAARFPHGQLYVNLRGYDPGQPVSAADALAGFLRSLGMDGPEIAAGVDERAAQYRSALAGRRVLVVLDNASEEEQVRPLLPGTPTCAVVVTSRDGLAGLIAREGARRVDLGMLPPAEAVGLLRALIGDRVDADLDAAAALVELCCRLPLALRVAAELAARRPDARLADLAGELADERCRLDLLDAAGDPRTALRAVFSWSVRHLDAEAARAFRLLGLHPGPDFDPDAAAALTGTPRARAVQLLNLLARAHLIQPGGPGRYGMHDLLRVYARELAGAQYGAHDRRDALTRLFDHYLYTAAAAMALTFPAESDRRPQITPPNRARPVLTDSAAAWAWLDIERPTLAAVVAHAAARGWPGHATRLAATLLRYLETGGYHTETVAIHDHARRAARALGDRAAEAEALRGLIVIDLRQGRYRQAADRLEQLLVIHGETGNRPGEADALGNLGIAGLLQGRYRHAISRLEQALSAYREIGDQAGTARQLSNLALVEIRLGSYRRAAEHLDQALTLCRETGNRSAEAYALSNLGVTSLRLGNHIQAGERLHQALTICRDSGNRDCEAYALGNLGLVLYGKATTSKPTTSSNVR